MRPLHQGAPWLAALSPTCGTRARGRSRRRRTKAGPATLIGAILAGGASARFAGSPKGLAIVGGRRIIDRIADAMRPVVSRIVIISNDVGAPAWLAGVSAYADRRPERGSLVGIHTALTAATGDDVLLVAWDMPFVDTPLLSAIASRLEKSGYAAVPETERGIEATCAAYTAACLPVAERLLDARTMKLSAFVGELPEHATITRDELTDIGDPGRLFFNVNTTADLARASAMASQLG